MVQIDLHIGVDQNLAEARRSEVLTTSRYASVERWSSTDRPRGGRPERRATSIS